VIPRAAARIFSIIDVWDAMGSDRPYREKLSEEVIIAYIQSQNGKQFDPAVVEHFMAFLKKRKQSPIPPPGGKLPTR
jgi:response regulator RpfG family c-di-GMP phosphodiesterase